MAPLAGMLGPALGGLAGSQAGQMLPQWMSNWMAGSGTSLGTNASGPISPQAVDLASQSTATKAFNPNLSPGASVAIPAVSDAVAAAGPVAGAVTAPASAAATPATSGLSLGGSAGITPTDAATLQLPVAAPANVAPDMIADAAPTGQVPTPYQFGAPTPVQTGPLGMGMGANSTLPGGSNAPLTPAGPPAATTAGPPAATTAPGPGVMSKLLPLLQKMGINTATNTAGNIASSKFNQPPTPQVQTGQVPATTPVTASAQPGKQNFAGAGQNQGGVFSMLQQLLSQNQNAGMAV